MDLTQAQLNADQAAVNADQSALNAAQATLNNAQATYNADQATYNAEQAANALYPALPVLDEIEAFVSNADNGIPSSAQSSIIALCEQARGLISTPASTPTPTPTPTPTGDAAPATTGVATSAQVVSAGGGEGPP